MKVRRTIGGALFGIGCAVTFVGILATVLPMVQNDQLQLVLSSFEMPSGNLIVSAVNGAMTYALHHCYGVLLCGIAMMAVGMGILLHCPRRPPGSASPAPPAAGRPRLTAARRLRPQPNPYGRRRMPTGRHGSRGKREPTPLRGRFMRTFPPVHRLRRCRRPTRRRPFCRPPMPRMNPRPMPGPLQSRLRRPPWRSLLMQSLSLQHRLWGSGHPRRSRQRRLLWSLPPWHRPCRSRRQRLHHLPFRGWTQLPLFPSRPRRRPYLPIPRLARPARADHA